MFTSIAWSLLRRTKYKCGVFFLFLTGDIPLRKHSSHAAPSARGPSAALRTCCVVSLSADESLGTVQKTRWVWDMWWVQRSGVGGPAGFKLKTIHSVPALPRRRHRFTHATLQTAGEKHVNMFEVMLFHPRTIKPEVLIEKFFVCFMIMDGL